MGYLQWHRMHMACFLGWWTIGYGIYVAAAAVAIGTKPDGISGSSLLKLNVNKLIKSKDQMDIGRLLFCMHY